ncbi:MAG: ABC transporter ATP-binding protein [Clostridia bacterium]|nr:ABC transporter ATP-binding protein [Clostridia bacterium]
MGRSTHKVGAPDKPLDRAGRTRVLLRVCKYLFKDRFAMLGAFVMMLVSNLLALAGPKITGLIIDAIDAETGVDMNTVTQWCIVLVVFYVISAVMSYFLAVLMAWISQRVSYTMRREVFAHLTELPVGYFDTHQTGDIVSHISYDIDTVNASLSHDLLQICVSVVTVVGSLAMMLSISPLLLCVFVITVPVSILFTKYKTKKIRPLFRKRSAKLGELNGFAEEMLSGHRTIKAYHREIYMVEEFDGHNTEACEAYYRADYQGSMIGPTVNFVNNLSLCLITVLGGVFYLLTLSVPTLPAIFVIGLGDVSAFVQYSRKFSGPINEFANILSEFQSACSAAERVFALLDEPGEVADAPDAKILPHATGEVRGDVTMEDVHFSYVQGKEILHSLSLKADKGKLIAIVGPTGAGKTTVINLLMRFYDIDSGRITVDGHEIRDLTRDSLRLSYTMVLQDTWLFCGTVLDNITYGTEGATMEDAVKAAKAARIHDFIMSLPDGYMTVLSDDGVNISKGQKQLLTIARAMLSRAPVLILDEATSNVDSRTEHLIQEALYALMQDRTCFVIAHRLSTIKNANTILVVKDGVVIESGNHDELLAQKGFYASLYNAQYK